MSTRAVYTFKDKRERNQIRTTEFSVYKHHDGYPTGAARWITAAIPLAWPLPRYEACEFAAAFIAANKSKSGDIYCTRSHEDHGDLDYRYEITCEGGIIFIRAFKVSSSNIKKIWFGTLEDFCKEAETI